MPPVRLLAGLFLCFWMAVASAQEHVPVPPLSGHVVDQVGLLNLDQRAALEQRLIDYEARTGSQIALLLVSSTAPEALEQYSIRVADNWKLGRKNVDDGLIVLVAKDNPKALHRLRIEAGRGVQGSLTDLQSKRILQEVIAPYFQRNDFNGGLNAGVSEITALLDHEQLPAPPRTVARADAHRGVLTDAMPLLLLGAFIAIVLIARLRRRGSALGQGDWGHHAGVILGSAIGSNFGSSNHGDSSGSSDSGFTGGGGGFDGGGASGDW